MASKYPVAYELNAHKGKYNITTDVVKWAIVTNTYASIDANAATLDISDFTVVASAGNYVAGTTLANSGISATGANISIDGDNFNIAADPANPVNGCCIIYYNETAADDDIICVADITTDGTTPRDLTTGINIAIDANGITLGTMNA